MSTKTKATAAKTADELVINGIAYVPKSSVPNNVPAPKLKNMTLVIVRAYGAGVYFGYLEKQTGKEVTLRNARNIYYWDGAATLLQMANEGVAKPENCKFTMPVDTIHLTDAVAIIPVTAAAAEILNKVIIWKK